MTTQVIPAFLADSIHKGAFSNTKHSIGEIDNSFDAIRYGSGEGFYV